MFCVQTVYKLGDLRNHDVCSNPLHNVASLLTGRVAAVDFNDSCTLCELGEAVQEQGAAAALVLLTDEQLTQVSLKACV